MISKMIQPKNKKKKVYDGKNITVNIYDISLKNKKFEREIVEQNGASAVLAFEGKNVLLVKQHRFPHGYVLEIPAGTLKKNEKPRDCAIRELVEETGYKPKKLKHLIDYYPNVGYNTQFIHCYVASDIEKIYITASGGPFLNLPKSKFKKVCTTRFKATQNSIKK